MTTKAKFKSDALRRSTAPQTGCTASVRSTKPPCVVSTHRAWPRRRCSLPGRSRRFASKRTSASRCSRATSTPANRRSRSGGSRHEAAQWDGAQVARRRGKARLKVLSRQASNPKGSCRRQERCLLRPVRSPLPGDQDQFSDRLSALDQAMRLCGLFEGQNCADLWLEPAWNRTYPISSSSVSAIRRWSAR